MTFKNERKVANTASEFLDNLIEFFINCEDMSKEELEQELREAGINVENLLTKVQTLVEKKLKTERIKQAKEKQKVLLKQMDSVVFDIPKTSMELKERIIEMFKRPFAQDYAQAYFRKLEGLTENDLISIYKDLKKLESLEKQSKKDKNNI